MQHLSKINISIFKQFFCIKNNKRYEKPLPDIIDSLIQIFHKNHQKTIK